VPGDLVQSSDFGDRQFGVAAGDEAEVGDDPLAEPQVRDALAQRLDDAGDLAAGDGGQEGRLGRRSLCALAQGGVQEVDTRRPYGDTDLAGARPGVLDLLVGEVLGRAEGVQADGVHGGSSRGRPVLMVRLAAHGSSGAHGFGRCTPAFNLKLA
jgi:hypothetical protein